MVIVPMDVVRRFASTKAISDSDALEIFSELERFLDDACTVKRVPTKQIDDAWHEFILHTRDYADYCMRRFGKFIHHVPELAVSDANCDLAKCSNCSSSCSKR